MEDGDSPGPTQMLASPMARCAFGVAREVGSEPAVRTPNQGLGHGELGGRVFDVLSPCCAR